MLAPEHPLVDKITKPEFKAGVDEYRESTKTLTEIERTSTVKEKTGVPTGAYAINPVNGEKIPVWIADYALITYGTGVLWLFLVTMKEILSLQRSLIFQSAK